MFVPTLRSQSVCESEERRRVCESASGVKEELVQYASPARAFSLGSYKRRKAA